MLRRISIVDVVVDEQQQGPRFRRFCHHHQWWLLLSVCLFELHVHHSTFSLEFFPFACLGQIRWFRFRFHYIIFGLHYTAVFVSAPTPTYKCLCLQMQNYENDGKSFLNACRVSHRTFPPFSLLLFPFFVIVGDDDGGWTTLVVSICCRLVSSHYFSCSKWHMEKSWKSNARLDDDSWTLENDLNWFWFCTTG